MNAIEALKLAYRKHHLGDESIGWSELSDCLLDALCNELGDDGFQEWLASNQSLNSDRADDGQYDEDPGGYSNLEAYRKSRGC